MRRRGGRQTSLSLLHEDEDSRGGEIERESKLCVLRALSSGWEETGPQCDSSV